MIGITSIPGMVARLIINILIAVPDYEQAFDVVPIIQRLGYTSHGMNNCLRQYYFDKGQTLKYILYVVEVDGETWINRIAFRDYLRENVDIANAYADYKRQLFLDLSAFQCC